MSNVQRTDFGAMACSIARTLDIAGEPWSPLIVREIWIGTRRFDEIRRNLGISRKVLAQRLTWLADHGVVAQRAYSRRPLRHEYVLTEKGSELCNVLLAMTAWGDRWTAGNAGPPALLRHRACGDLTHVDLRCARCGGPLEACHVDVEPGPGAAPPAAGTVTRR